MRENEEDPAHETGSWTVEEINLLADEAEEMISRRESLPWSCKRMDWEPRYLNGS